MEVKPIKLACNVVQERLPLKIGLGVEKYVHTKKMKSKKYFKFKRPHDNRSRKCFTYIAKDDNADERI